MNCPLDFSISKTNTWNECIPATGSGFVKSLQFSPDGLCTISATENNDAVICSLSEVCVHSLSYYGSNGGSADIEEDLSRVESTIPIGEAIYDLKWYPGMQSSNPGSKCFISTSRDHPITLWDAGSDIDQAIARCTYRGYDLADELDSAISLTFNLTGDKIYAGYERMIRCFDVANPGKDCTQFPTSPTKRAPTGQKGLISSLAFNPDYSGAYAAGSYAHSVGVYVENMPDCALLFGNIEFGVTCLKWSPCGHYLWVGGRNNDNIVCYDIRTTQSIVGSVQRKLTSNQRMSFDLDPWGKFLCTGDQDGKVLFFDTSSFQLVHTIEHVGLNEYSVLGGPCKQGAKQVCVNSVAFHPFSALLGVASGERMFTIDSDSSDSDCDSISPAGHNITDGMMNVSSAATESKEETVDNKKAHSRVKIVENPSSVGWLQLPYTPLVLPDSSHISVPAEEFSNESTVEVDAQEDVMEVKTTIQ